MTDDLRAALHAHRRRTPVQSFPADRAASSDIRTGYLDGLPVRRLVITFRAPGCVWVTAGGGCLMCGHWAGTTRGVRPSTEETVQQFETEIARYDTTGIPVLSLYNSGSMLNPDEMSPDALGTILDTVRRVHPGIRKVVLESRAEFVTADRLATVRSAIGENISLSVAIGLETGDDRRRALCVNKGCDKAEMGRAIDTLHGLAHAQVYVFFGLPFLTEREMIEDTATSIRVARDLGADEIHIEPATLQRHTLLWDIHSAGAYRLPSLYSLYEVLREVMPDIRPYVSPFLHMPLPEFIPEGCPACTERLIDGLLDRYNITRDSAALAYSPCACMESWRARLEERDERSVEERVAAALDMLATRTST
jgi:archaeosine synthase beta-subunit